MNAPDKLALMMQTQISEVALKAPDTGNAETNARLEICTVSFKTPPNGAYGSYDYSNTNSYLEIAGPHRLSTKSKSFIDFLIAFLASRNSNGSALFSTKNAIYLIRSVQASSTDGAPINAPILSLAGNTVTVKAYGNTYNYTFPSADQLQYWGLILTGGIFEASKVE